MPDPTITEYAEKYNGLLCGFCFTPLNGMIRYHPHAEGWMIRDFEMPQWIYMHCDHCKYHWHVGLIEVLRTHTNAYWEKVAHLKQELSGSGVDIRNTILDLPDEFQIKSPPKKEDKS